MHHLSVLSKQEIAELEGLIKEEGELGKLAVDERKKCLQKVDRLEVNSRQDPGVYKRDRWGV